MLIQHINRLSDFIHGSIQRGGGGGRGPDTRPCKSQVAIVFSQNTGTDLLEKQLDLSGPIASRGRSIRSSVK